MPFFHLAMEFTRQHFYNHLLVTQVTPTQHGKVLQRRKATRKCASLGPTEKLTAINIFYTLAYFATADISLAICFLSKGFRAYDIFHFLLKGIR